MDSHKNDDFNDDLYSSFHNIMNAPDAFVAIDYDLKFLFVNALAEKFYKRDKADLLGTSVATTFPAEVNFGPFKDVLKNVKAKKQIEITYQSPFVNQWVKLVGRPFENYYTFTYSQVDYKEVLKNELRKEMKKKK